MQNNGLPSLDHTEHPYLANMLKVTEVSSWPVPSAEHGLLLLLLLLLVDVDDEEEDRDKMRPAHHQ